jgi:hypothetical protein
MIESIRNLTSKLARATSSVKNEIADLRKQIAETRLRLTNARGLPVPVDEIDTRIRTQVADAGAYFIKEWGTIVVNSLGDPNLRGTAKLPWSWKEAPPWAALCAADPEGAAALLSSIVRRVPFEAAAPSNQRASLIARLEHELAELEATEESAIAEACEAGITIERRPEVIQRLQNEARQRELDAQEVAAREARQQKVDETYSRTQPSKYLATGKL